MRWSEDITNSEDMNLGKLREMVSDRGAWRAVVHGVTKSQTPFGQLNNKQGQILKVQRFLIQKHNMDSETLVGTMLTQWVVSSHCAWF